MNEVTIFLIYAPNCQHCEQMEMATQEAIKKSGIPCNLKKLLYTSQVAINIALKSGISDLPGLAVGTNGESFCGDDYSEERILNAIKKVANSWIKKNQKKQK